MPPRGPGPLVANLVIALLCLIWGSTYLVIREGLEDLPAFSSAALRFTLAAAGFLGVSAALRRREGGTPPPWWLVVSFGVLNFAVPYAVIYWTERVIPSGLAAVLFAVFPMMMAALGHLFLPGETLRGPQWLGFLVGFLGVAVLFHVDLRSIGPDALGLGVLYLVAPLTSAVGQVFVKRQGAGMSSLLLTRYGLMVGAALLWCLVPLEQGASTTWTPKAIFSVAYLAIIGTVVTFGFYYWLLRYLPAYRLSLIAYITPAIALFLGAWLGHERIGPSTLGGTGLILAGVVLVARRGR